MGVPTAYEPMKLKYLCLALALAPFGCEKPQAPIEKPQAPIKEVVAATRPPDIPTLEEQVQCEKYARAFYKEVDYNNADYSSHYNTGMKKCFVAIHSSQWNSGMLWTTNQLYDAVERRIYGSYMWHNDAVKKYWEVEPVECYVKTSGEKKFCKSDYEFEQLASEYMDVSF